MKLTEFSTEKKDKAWTEIKVDRKDTKVNQTVSKQNIPS